MKDILKDRNGFSLLECMIVISCAVILATIAVPNVCRLSQEWKLWGTTRSLEASLQWGRMHAITANTPMLFNVLENGRQYCWMDATSGDQYENTTRILPDDIQIESSPRRSLRFYHYGNAVPAGTYVIRGGAGSYSVVVSPGGRIRIQKN